MNIELVDTGKIKKYAKNTKKHDEKQVTKIAASIKEFGFNTPILLDKDNTLIAGHGRLLAAIKLGMEQVPSIRLENLSEAQIKAYRIADNKVAESDWIQDLLKEEILDLKSLNYDLSLTGFDLKEVNSYVKGLENVHEVEADDPNKVTTQIKKGDIIQLGNHYLMCGDSTNSEDIDKLVKIGGGVCRFNVYRSSVRS